MTSWMRTLGASRNKRVRFFFFPNQSYIITGNHYSLLLPTHSWPPAPPLNAGDGAGTAGPQKTGAKPAERGAEKARHQQPQETEREGAQKSEGTRKQGGEQERQKQPQEQESEGNKATTGGKGNKKEKDGGEPRGTERQEGQGSSHTKEEEWYIRVDEEGRPCKQRFDPVGAQRANANPEYLWESKSIIYHHHHHHH